MAEEVNRALQFLLVFGVMYTLANIATFIYIARILEEINYRNRIKSEDIAYLRNSINNFLERRGE